MEIMEFFRGTPRKSQSYILQTLQNKWTEYDVFVIQAPVATGKSRIAVALADWIEAQGRTSAILTPSNILANQYAQEFQDLTLLHKKGYYKSQKIYASKVADFRNSPKVLGNYFIPLAHKITKDVFIYDEAHNLVEIGGTPIKLWQHLYDWPDTLKTEIDLEHWLEKAWTGTIARDKILDKVRNLLGRIDVEIVIETKAEEYRGKIRKLLTITPLSCRSDKPIFWPKAVKKLVLMSGTINKFDIHNLGVDSRRVLYIECDSEIPAGNRPVLPLNVINVNHSNSGMHLGTIARTITQLLGKHPTSGIVHCTYEMAKQLKPLLDHVPRLKWHGKGNRTQVYNEFISGKLGSDAVLMACGMSEGVDLSYDLARWQVICKVPYRSLADMKVRANAEQHPHLYAWWAIRTIVQATGRVCRNPDDFGITYILDRNFNRLRKDWPTLWPKYYKHAIVDSWADTWYSNKQIGAKDDNTEKRL